MVDLTNLTGSIASPSDLALTAGCPICEHPRRKEIDAALAVPGAQPAVIARQFQCYRMQLKRHLPHLAAGALALIQQDDPVEIMKRRVRSRASTLFEASKAAIQNASQAGAGATDLLQAGARLAEAAFKYDQLLAKLQGMAQPEPSGATIHANDAQIVIQQGPS